MDILRIFPYFFVLMFVAIVVVFIVNIFRHGGFKDVIFGAPIVATIGEFELASGTI